MKALVFAILPTAFLLLSANAEEFNATNANGLVSGKPDLASLDYWQQMGKDRLPQSADTVKLSGRATENPYCASADLTITNILFSASGSYIDLTTDDGSQRTITLTTDGNAMEFSSGSAGYSIGNQWKIVDFRIYENNKKIHKKLEKTIAIWKKMCYNTQCMCMSHRLYGIVRCDALHEYSDY